MKKTNWLPKVKKNSSVLAEIPELELTEEIWKIGLNTSGALKYIPEDYRTWDMCLYSLSNFGFDPDTINSVPHKIWTSDRVESFIREYPYLIKVVPASLLTQDLCDEAMLQRRAPPLSDIPSQFITAKNCQLALKNPDNFQNIPETFLNQSLMDLAFERNAANFQYIPSNYKSQSMCNHAILDCAETEGWMRAQNIKFIPGDYLNQELCDHAIKFDSALIEFLPNQHKGRDICVKAVSSRGANISFVPIDILDEEICIIAAKKGARYESIPVQFLTDLVCAHCIIYDATFQSLEYQLPPEFFTESRFLAAINLDESIVSSIPVDCLTLDLCKIAIKHGLKNRLNEKKLARKFPDFRLADYD